METRLVMGPKHTSKQNQGHNEQRAERAAGPKATQRAPRRCLGIAREMVNVQPNEDPGSGATGAEGLWGQGTSVTMRKHAKSVRTPSSCYAGQLAGRLAGQGERCGWVKSAGPESKVGFLLEAFA